VTLLEFLLNLNSLQSDFFSRPFFTARCLLIFKDEKQQGKHKRKNTMRTTEETVKSTYFPSKIRLQQDIHRQLFLQHSLES